MDNNCRCKLESASIIVVLLLLIVVVIWSRNFFDKLVDNMKDARAQVVRYDGAFLSACSCATGSVCVSNSAFQKAEPLPTGVTNETAECGVMIPYTTGKIGEKFQENNEHDDSMSICNAYEALDREFTSWLTVLGLFAGMFGLIVPLISYLLQHKTLKDERESVNKLVDGLRAERNEMYSEMNKARKDFRKFKAQSEYDVQSVGKIAFETKEQIAIFSQQTKKQLLMWKRQVVAFSEYSLASKLNQIQALRNKKVFDEELLVDSVNLIVAFDYLLESLINWREEDAIIVRAKMQEWIANIGSFWFMLSDVERKRVCDKLKQQFKPSSEFATRDDFLRILREDSDEFKWLEKFYKPFAPWKFS